MKETRFGMLGARIETELKGPAIIAITSAMPGDGKSVAARGLCEALSKAGYRGVLVDAAMEHDPESVSNSRQTLHRIVMDDLERCISETDVPGMGFLSLSSSSIQMSASRDGVERLFDQLKQRCDYAVIDTNCAVNDPFATYVTAKADAVMVSVRIGRARTSRDGALSALLERVNARFLGLIAVERKAIERVPTPKNKNTGILRTRRPIVTGAALEEERMLRFVRLSN